MQSGTVVWAKLASYPYWPSKILQEDEVEEALREQLNKPTSGNMELVYFFGSDNCNYVPRSQIELWEEGYQERSTNKKAKTQKLWVKALKEAEKWIEAHGDGTERKTDTKKTVPKKVTPVKKAESSGESSEEEELPKKSSKTKKSIDEGEVANIKKKSTKGKRKQDHSSDEEESTHVDEANKRPKSEGIQINEAELVRPQDSSSKKKLTPTAVSLSLKTIQKHPVAKYFKYEITKTSEGSASGRAVLPNVRSHREEVHSCIGAIHYLLDITAYAACASIMSEADSTLTQSVHTTVLSPNIPLGAELTLSATVLPSKSTGLLFISAEALINSKQVVIATITKSTAEYNFPINVEF